MCILAEQLPPTIMKIGSYVLVGVIMPVIFIFELIVVLPDIHKPGGFFHTYSVAMAIFLLFNVYGNWLYCIMIDTSVNFETLKPPEDADTKGWRHCKHCDKLAPPRSWHCTVCRVCILKRDHHCIFTGCCVGYNNQRYFFLFVVFFFIGASYTFVYNSLYIWVLNADVYRNLITMGKIILPTMFMLYGSLWQNIVLSVYFFNLFSMMLAFGMLIFEVPNVIRGSVCLDRTKNKWTFNAGWKRNLEDVFGERMHLVWLSPLIRSALPHDGAEWKASGDAVDTDFPGPKEAFVVVEVAKFRNIASNC